MAALIIKKRCSFFAATATKHFENALHHFSTAFSPLPAPPAQKCPPLKKPTKVAAQPKRPRPSTPVSVLGKSRSSRFADAAAQRAAQDQDQLKLQQMKKLKKEKKKKRETPLFEALTVSKPVHSDLPFAFRWSYTEVPKVQPIGFQEKYSPFGPGRLDRPWDGQEALPADTSSPIRKQRENRKRHVIDSFNPPSKKGIKPVTEPGPFLPGTGPKRAKTREEILGEPLTKEETEMLLRHSLKTKKQINIGRDGLTHNLLICFYEYWTRERLVRVKCKGVSTVDMDNVIFQIEDKSGGKVIHRAGGTLHVFRGRYYNNRDRPNIPKMLWRPHSPIYPKLVTQKPGGLKLQEANALRKRGREILPLCKLAKNGYYGDLVENIREAFQEDNLVRIDCTAVNRPDYKKIGAKLRDLVPCVLLSFQRDQILLWKGRDNRKAKKELPAKEAGSISPGNSEAAETVEELHDSCEGTGEISGDEDEEGQDDGSEDTGELSGAEDEEGKDDDSEDTGESSGLDDGFADSCEDTDAFSAATDDSGEDTDSFSTTDDDSCEDEGFNDDINCETVIVGDTDEEVDLINNDVKRSTAKGL
eukprot:c23395_g2_i1 orf=148-1905(+)